MMLPIYRYGSISVKGDLLVHAANLSKAAVPITIRQSANGETNASLAVVVRPTT